jgi:hypothetical protein
MAPSGTKRLSFRDRFYTPPVARAINSPLGILLGGAGIAAGIAIGLPIIAALGVGALAYGARVAVAIPKGHSADGINPFELEDPWRTFVWQAKKSQRQFADAVKHIHEGPLRDRLREISDRIDTGVSECWQVAQGGNNLTQARARIDITGITTELSQLPTGQPLQANPALVDTAKALQSQLDTAKRMDEIISSTRDRLRLLDARLGELVTRVIELSVRPQGLEDLAAVGADVDSVVGEMEALRLALDETDRTSSTSRGVPMMDPSALAAPLPEALQPPGGTSVPPAPAPAPTNAPPAMPLPNQPQPEWSSPPAAPQPPASAPPQTWPPSPPHQ